MHEGYWWRTLVKVGMGCAWKLPFQECGMTFLADLSVQMAWVLFFSQSDAFHVSQGPEFCPLQPCSYTRNFYFNLM